MCFSVSSSYAFLGVELRCSYKKKSTKHVPRILLYSIKVLSGAILNKTFHLSKHFQHFLPFRRTGRT